MPKEKTTTRKAAAKPRTERKKKGVYSFPIDVLCIVDADSCSRP